MTARTQRVFSATWIVIVLVALPAIVWLAEERERHKMQVLPRVNTQEDCR